MVARCRKRNGRQVIALEMLEDVEAGEELLWDYGDDYLTSDEEE
jgi:SET domain-containing protein